jgi:hypothetical protein
MRSDYKVKRAGISYGRCHMGLPTGLFPFGVALVLLAACGEEEEVALREPSLTPVLATVAPVSSTPTGSTLWRWVNVTLNVPDDGRFFVIQTSDPAEARPPRGGSVLRLHKVSSEGLSYPPSSWVHIDAETGSVIGQEIRGDDQAEIQAVLDTLTVSPLDLSTAEPYAPELPPDLPRETKGGMSFVRPAIDTCLLVGGNIGDPGGPGLSISNAISGLAVAIDRATGELIVDTQFLLPEYEAVFMRWVDSIKICGSEIQC